MKLLKSLAAGAVIAMLGAGVASAQTALKIGHGHSDKHSFHLAMEKFSEILEQKAPGAFTVTIFPQAQLGSEREMQEQLTTGTLEVTITGVLAIVSFGAGLKNVAALSILLLFLFIRPSGLFGSAK